MGFSAVNLRGVLGLGQDLPYVPDFRDISNRLDAIISTVSELDGGKDVVGEIEDLRRDVDCGDSLSDYIDAAEQVIQDMHDEISRVYSMVKERDFYNMDATDMMSLFEETERGLYYAQPKSLFIREITYQLPSFFDYQTFKIMSRLAFLNGVIMECTEKDIYAGEYRPRVDIFDRWGDMLIEVHPDQIFFSIPLTDSSMVIKRAGKIFISTNTPHPDKDGMEMVEEGDLKEYFVDWLMPTEEEISLFDTVNPGWDFTVLRYVRDCMTGAG